MQRAGQFLVQPSDFLGWFTALGIVSVGVMVFTLFKLRANYLLRLSPSVTPERFATGLGVGGALSILSTLLLTTTSLVFFGRVVQVTGADVNEDRAQAAGIEQSRYSSIRPNAALVHVAIRGLRGLSGNRAAQVAVAAAVVAAVLLLVVGAGYAFTTLQLGFWGGFAAMSAGVALPEELTKAAAGTLVLYLLFDTRSLSQVQFRRTVLAAFAIAGLGFGAGEALKYFGAYANEDAGAFWYGIRPVWCVTLHGAWTMLVGAILSTDLPQDPTTLANNWAETFFVMLVASVPTAIAHGLYNACCDHGPIMPWIVGGISLFMAFAAVEGFLENKPEEPNLADQAH